MNDLFIQGLTIDWNRVRPYNYVRQIPAISGIDTFTFHKPITFFVGENGSGKSTLLEAIAVAYGFNAEGGTKNYSFSTYNSHSELCEAMTISKGYRRPKFGYFLRAESFYNVATKEIDYSDDDHPSKGYHQKSHGESFLAIAQDYMGADGVYIFDEPEAALSPQRQLTLLINIYRCAQAVSVADGAFRGFDPFRFPEVYDSVTRADVEAFLRESIVEERSALSILIPKKEGASQ